MEEGESFLVGPASQRQGEEVGRVDARNWAGMVMRATWAGPCGRGWIAGRGFLGLGWS